MGRTANFRRQRSDNPVHPHPRGENVLFATATLFWNGTPPPAWGEHFRILTDEPFPRYTPTRVGRTCPPPIQNQNLAVHPHPRGENPSKTLCKFSPAGTPPPAWGQLDGRHDLPLRARYTPTRVGTTAQSCRGHGTTPVHPHPRGENHAKADEDNIPLGTPPPAWGEHRMANRRHSAGRYTPTRVGRTLHLAGRFRSQHLSSLLAGQLVCHV